MSKRLLSLIKPRQNPKPNSSNRVYNEPHIKKLANEACQLLKTHQNWDQTLETLLNKESVDASEIAHLVFDRIKDVSLGLRFYDWFMERKFCSFLDGYAFSSLLKLLAKNRVFSEVENVLSCMKSHGLLPTIEAFDMLIRAYADALLVDKARDFYEFVRDTYCCMPSAIASNSLLIALVEKGQFVVARQVYDEMLERDCLDNYSTCIMVRGFCEQGKVEDGVKLIEGRWGKGCVPNVVFYNTLVDGYCKRGDIGSANRILHEMKFKGFLPTLETYGAIINGLCKDGNFREVDKLLEEMKMRGLRINVQIYNNIADAKIKHGCAVEPFETIRKLKENDCKPDIMTYNTLISGSCSRGKIEEAHILLEQAIKRGLKPDQYSYTPFVHFYCKQGDMDSASCLLIEMTERGHPPDMVTYGALVHGLVSRGDIEAASSIRKKMMGKGVVPDAGIYNVLMSALFRRGLLSAAKQLLCEMLDENVHPDAFIYTTLVDGFARNGNINEAEKIFQLELEKDLDPGVVGYNAMIKGYCKLGRMNDAILCFRKMHRMLSTALQLRKKMMSSNVLEDSFTFVALLHGICLEGRSREWRNIIKYDLNEEGIHNAISYLKVLDMHLPDGISYEASVILHQLLKDCQFSDHEANNIKVSAS